jgi:hypothetical protein
MKLLSFCLKVLVLTLAMMAVFAFIMKVEAAF